MFRTMFFGTTSLVVRTCISSIAPVSVGTIRTDKTPGRVAMSSWARLRGSTLPTTGLEGTADCVAPRLIGIDRYGSGEGSAQAGSTDKIVRQYADESATGQGAQAANPLSDMDVTIRTSSCVEGRFALPRLNPCLSLILTKLPVQRALPNAKQVGRLSTVPGSIPKRC